MKKLFLAIVFIATSVSAATFNVTTNADAGPGSLRDAIAQANAQCDGSVVCAITLDPAVEHKILELASPLPAITACGITIGDPAFDSALGKRALEISGAKLDSGNGLEVRSRCGISNDVTITGLSITGFPDNGIAVLPPEGGVTHGESAPLVHLRGNNIGIDAGGFIDRRNGWRGIVVADDPAQVVVEQSVISANGRSGIFVWVADFVTVRNNRIGIDVNGFPRPNGASGIYLGRAAGEITQNTIAFSRDFGVAVSPTARRASVTQNSLYENGWLGIDWALDGLINHVLPADAIVPLPPTVTDVNGQTIRGVAHVRAKDAGGTYRILFYSTEAWRQHAEGEHSAGAMTIDVPNDGNAHDIAFEFRSTVPLFDTIITAQASVAFDNIDNTSELSEGVRYSCCR